GQAQLNFDLSDAVTTFRVLVVSHTLDGRLGADTLEFASQLPYSIEPKVPVEVSPSDKLVLPLAATNNTAEKTSLTTKLTQSSGAPCCERSIVTSLVTNTTRTRSPPPERIKKTPAKNQTKSIRERPACPSPASISAGADCPGVRRVITTTLLVTETADRK